MGRKEDSAEKLYSFIDFLHHKACILDKDGNIEKLNSIWQSVSEETKTDLLNVRENVNYLVNCEKSEDKECQRFAEALHGIIQGNKDFFEMVYADFISNEKKDFLVRTYPLAELEDTKFMVEHIDITEARAKSDKEKRAQKLEAEYETILDNIHDAMFFVKVEKDSTFRFIMNNRQHQKLTGLSQAQLTGKTPHELLDKETADFVVSNYEACVREKSAVDYEETLGLPAGKGTYHTVLTPVIENGEVVKIIGSGRDLTDKKRMEEMNEKFFEGLPYPAWLVDYNRQILSQNQVGKTMFGSEIGETCWFSFHGTRTLPEDQRKYYEETGELPPDAKCSFCRADEALSSRQPIVEEVELDGIVFESGWVPLDEHIYLRYAIDVTRYKEAEKKCRESEEMFRYIAEFSPLPIAIIDGEGNYEYINPKFTEVFGYTLEDIPTGKDWFKLAFPDQYSRQEALQVWKRDLQEMGSDVDRPRIFKVTCRDGTVKDIFFRPVLMDNGKNLITYEDITERKKTEEKLKKTTELFNKVQEATNDGVWDWDITTGEAYFSNNYYTMLGFVPGEFEASYESWRNLLHTEDLQVAEEEIGKSFAGKKEGFDIEFRAKTKDGGYKWINGRGKVVERDENGVPIRAVGSHIDINEKKEREEMIRSIINGAKTVSLIVTDLNGIVKEFSPGAESIFGYSRKEILGKHASPLHTPSEAQKFPEYAERLKKNKEGFTIETELVRKSGEKFPARFTLEPLFDNEGNVSGTLGISIDISDIKAKEKELVQNQMLLEGTLNAVPDVIGIQYPDHIIERYNRAGYEMLNMTHKEVKGRKCYELIGRESECEKCATRQALKTKKLETIEKYFPELDLYLNARSNPILNEEGEIEYIVEQIQDVTDYNKTLNALKESEERFRSFVENANDIIFTGSDKGYFTYVPPNWQDIIGHHPDEIIGDVTFKLIHPEDVEDVADRASEVLNNEKLEKEVEYRVKTREGNWRWHAAKLSLLERREDETIVLGIARDITERKQAEEHNQFLSEIVENLFDSVVATDTNFQITYINKAAKELFGYELEEIKGETPEIFNAEPNAEELQNRIYETVSSGDTFQDELLNKRKDGTTFINEFKTMPMINEKGEIYSYVGFQRDITERKQAEKALRQSEERFRFLVENASEGILVAQDGLVKYVNPEITRLSGYGIEEMLETPFIEYIHPDDKDMVLDKHQKRLQGEKLEERYRFRVVRKDGEVRWVELSTGVVEWETRPATINLVIDITEKKEAEERIHYLSFHDILTGLYNRAYFEEEMKRLDTERQLPISIIMVDLNGLKLVNDTYGHHMGDQMLKETAEILRNSCRSEDIVARWGGDEFGILLPQTSEDELEVIENRIINNCEGVYVQDLPVSLSLGSGVKKTLDKKIKQALKEAEDNMYKYKLAESRSARSSVLYALLKTLGEKSYETEAHTQRMMTFAWRIGEKIGLSHTELNRLQLLITLHDIGKINFPAEMLTKKGPLDSEEWEMMREHPTIGYRIAKATEEFAHVAEEILSHHERWDGKGYPRGLEGDEIPLLARITAIVDAYDVMANGRPHKKAMQQEEIISELKRCAGTQFDPELVEVFNEVLEESSS